MKNVPTALVFEFYHNKFMIDCDRYVHGLNPFIPMKLNV